MKKMLFMFFSVLVLCAPCFAQTFHLKHDKTGQVYGPFDFPDATIRVLPLMADWDKLRRFTDAYLNFPDSHDSKEHKTQVDDRGNLKAWPGPAKDNWPDSWETVVPGPLRARERE